MKTRNSSVSELEKRPFFHVASLVGFATAVILAFVAGIFFGRSQNPGVGTTGPLADIPVARLSSVAPQPEHFYPAAEFRYQSGLLFGCYEHIQTDPLLYVDIARALGGKVPAFGLVATREQAAYGTTLMRENELPTDAMRFIVLPSNTIWVRDYAPFIVRVDSDSAVMVDAKYQRRGDGEIRKRDEEMAASLANLLRLKLRSIPLILDGGNFLSNADGEALMTAKTFLINREYSFSDTQIAGMMYEYLGVQSAIRVPQLANEPTGHVDMFATFPTKQVAVVGQMSFREDPENSLILDQAAHYIANTTTSLGPTKVVRIPMPSRWGQRWRSYTNVVYANGILLVPSYSDVDPAIEDEVVALYQSILPEWEIKKIPCDTLVKLGGQLHCISYHIPEYVSIDPLIEASEKGR